MDLVGHYRVLERIGSGGLGEVYRARDNRHGRTIALKILPQALAADPVERSRLLEASEDLLGLSHPSIAILYEVGEHAGRLFLAYEFVPGQSLRAAIAGRPMNPRIAVDLAVELAAALAEAHARGLVHGDLRPENVMVTPKGHAKILDFGMARWTQGGAARRALARDRDAGDLTLLVAAYMSPEQAMGEAVDHRTDIFTLGVMFFEMLTGQAPFRSARGWQSIVQALQVPPPPVTTLRRAAPPEADLILARALQTDPADRYQATATLAAELRSLAAMLDIREDAQEERTARAMRSRSRRGRRGLAAALALLAAIAAAWVWQDEARQYWQRTMAPPPPPIVAVVPEVDDPARRFLVQGVAEDLADRLAQVPGLSVVDRSFTQAAEPPPPGGPAAVVLHLRLAVRGDDLDVEAELRGVDEGFARWRGSFTAPRQAVLGLQTELAGAVADVLGVAPASTPVRVRSAARRVEPAAYDLFLRGRAAAARGDWPIAIEFYARAVAADDSLPEAHAGLALALQRRARAVGAPGDPDLMARARQAAMRAVAADADLARSQLAAGLTAPAFAEAARALRRAIELDPSWSAAYAAAGDLVVEVEPALGLRFYEQAVALDQGATRAQARAALALMRLGRHQEAEGRLERVGGAAAQAVQILLDLDRGRHASAAGVGGGVIEIGPMPALARVAALHEDGRTGEAFELASSIGLWFPPFCDVDALAAALRRERGQRAGAVAAAAGIFAEAARRDAPPPASGCAALAAAGMLNAPGAADWLERVAASEAALLVWASPGETVGRHTWFARRWYPWNQVPPQPPLERAAAALDAAVGRLRAEAQDILGGLVEQ